MYQQILTKKTIWSIVTVLFLTAAARAAIQENVNQPSTAAQQVTSQTVSKPMLFTVRSLIGSEVRSTMPGSTEHSGKTTKNQKLEKIGTVKELIINENQNRIEYVMVRVEKTKNEFYPVPWSAFNVKHLAWISNEQASNEIVPSLQDYDKDNFGRVLESSTWMPDNSKEESVLYLNITREQLMGAPSMTSISAERLSNPTMRQDIDNFYARYLQFTREPESTMSLRLVKFSDLRNLKVENAAGKNLGKIYDLVANAHEGQIMYSLVHFGGFLGAGQKDAVVPWTALTIQENPRYASINATRATLNKAVVRQDRLYKLNQPVFVRGIFSDYGMTPSAVYGFVPGDFDTKSMNAWQPGSDYNRLFNSKSMTSIKGTIRDVGSYEPDTGAYAGVVLTVETKDSRTFTVYAGPQLYASQKNISFSPGNSVEIKGSNVVFNNSSVIMASQIKIAHKTLKLYDSKGKPQWNTEKLIR